jgi:hypothetical protein
VSQVSYLKNIIEQDYRAIKDMSKPMLDFKSFRAAGYVLDGVELMHLIRKGQFLMDGTSISFADQFMRWQYKSVQNQTGQRSTRKAVFLYSTMRQNRIVTPRTFSECEGSPRSSLYS